LELNPTLTALLAPAYLPCVEFERACLEMCWNPNTGHVPRGFLGASGSINEVELVLVFAEPGDPHAGEKCSDLESAYEYARYAFETGKDLFHRNVRMILKMCWPTLSFDEQTRKVWLTESVLCSARKEGGLVSVAASKACGERYLLSQLSIFPKALVVALGRKAESRLRAVGFVNFLTAYSVAPPGCNRREAKPSWAQIPRELHKFLEDRK